MRKLLLAVFIIVIFIFTVFFSPIFKIKNINITQNRNCLSRDDLDIKGKNIFFLQKDNLTKALKDKLFCIEGIKITKQLPGAINFEIKTKDIVVKMEGTNFFATADGLIIESQENKDKPVFYPPTSLKFQNGQKVEDKVALFAFEIAHGLSKSDFNLASMRIVDPSDIAVYSQKNLVCIFSSKKTAAGQIDSLQKILAQAKIDASKIAKIDLRFDKPVITYE